jgi:hypothetical protein
MTNDTTDAEDASDSESGLLTGNCEHCEWHAVADSHAAVVQAYQDHLREEHPTVWLRT